MYARLPRTLLVAATSLTLMAGTLPATHATTTTISPSTTVTASSAPKTTTQATPANLPYRPLADIRAESLAKGLDAEATELAIELQKIVNAYHSLPDHLKDAPYDSPAVQDALLAATSPSLARGAIASGIDIGKASACAKAVVTTLVKKGTPIGQIWSFIETIGGVVEFAQGMSQIFVSGQQENAQRLVTNKWGPEMGYLLGKIFGYYEIVMSCKDLRI